MQHIKGVPIRLFAGESPEEEDDHFILCVYQTQHLISMIDPRSVASVADVRLKRKLRYEYANLKARGQLRNRSRYASATPVPAGSDHVLWSTRYLTPPLVIFVIGLRMTLSAMFKNIQGV